MKVIFGTRIYFPMEDSYFISPFLLIVYLIHDHFIYDVSENGVK